MFPKQLEKADLYISAVSHFSNGLLMWEIQGSKIYINDDYKFNNPKLDNLNAENGKKAQRSIRQDTGTRINPSHILSPPTAHSTKIYSKSIYHHQRKIRHPPEPMKQDNGIISPSVKKKNNNGSDIIERYNNISNIYNGSIEDKSNCLQDAEIMKQTSSYLSTSSRIVGASTYPVPNNKKVSSEKSWTASKYLKKNSRTEELFYSWIGDQWKKYVPAEEFKSPRVQTPSSNERKGEKNNPFHNVTPKLKKEKKYNNIKAVVTDIFNSIDNDAVQQKHRIPIASLDILSDRNRNAYNCIVNIIPYLAISSKRDAELLLQSCNILVDSFNKCTEVAKKLIKETNSSDKILMKTKHFFKKKINEISNITQIRERRSYEHLKQLEAHMIQQERDLLELRLNSSGANGSNDKSRGMTVKNINGGGGDENNTNDGNESDEDALSSRVYQNLLSEYNMLNDVNKALERELIKVQDDRDNCISMLSKLIGDGKTTKDLIRSLENRVEKIDVSRNTF